MLEHHYGRGKASEVPHLVSGDDVMERLGLSPGPTVGWLLEVIQEAQDMGEIASREEALDRAKSALALEGGRNGES